MYIHILVENGDFHSYQRAKQIPGNQQPGLQYSVPGSETFNQKVGSAQSHQKLYPLVMTNSLLLKVAIERVNVPIHGMVMFHGYIKLPEGMLFFPEYLHVW